MACPRLFRTMSKMLWSLVALVWALACSSLCEAFLFNAQVHPALETLSKVTPGTAFHSRLDFDYTDGRGGHHQLSIKGPVIELLNESSYSSSSVLPTIPSSDGIGSSLSTGGGKGIRVLEEAYFVGMQGLQQVPFEQGSWTANWMSNQLEGQLACTFHLPQPIRRGDAKITNGHVCFCFDLYSLESLSAGHEMKRRVQEQNAEAMNEKENHLEKMRATNNPVVKAFHYRNAFAAFEKVLYAPEVTGIPEIDELIELPNGLFLVKEGRMYRKGNGFIGPSWLKLGSVTVGRHLLRPNELTDLKP